MKKIPKNLSIKVITLFPNFINEFVGHFGILKKAVQNKLLQIVAVDLRQFGLDERQTVDDRPYGGGVGMVLRPDVLYDAIEKAKLSRSVNQFVSKSVSQKIKNKKSRVILLCPQGKRFVQKDAARLAAYDELIFVSGRYEGFDERIRKFVDEELSIGDYILMGGELPALVISEAVMRLRDGILGKLESTKDESFSEHLLEYPQYTKPEKWIVGGKSRSVNQLISKSVNPGKGSLAKRSKQKPKVLSVPKVLLTGHHKNINDFRSFESTKRTKKRRPDLLIEHS